MTTDAVPQWSTAAVAEAFRAEIHARLEAHNVAYRAREAAELEKVFREYPGLRFLPGYAVSNSGVWEIYQESEIQIIQNVVTIILPRRWAVGIDLVHLFDNTTMAWSSPSIGATVVDGEPRVTIQIVLVTTWTDEMDAKWRADGSDRRQVLVELYEDDVHALCGLIDAQLATAGPVVCDAAPLATIRERLKMSLEVLP